MKAVIECISFRWGHCLVLVFSVVVLVSVDASTSAAVSSPSTSSSQDFCVQWVTYKDPNSGQCVPCSPCPRNHLTVVLCEFDRDTLCRPSSDLGRHIETVVHSNVNLKENNVMDLILDEADRDSSISVLVISLSAVVTFFILMASLFTLKRCRNRRSRATFEDSMKQSLLQDDSPDNDNDNDRPTLDLDQLLAHRYGKSLVTNNYVP